MDLISSLRYAAQKKKEEEAAAKEQAAAKAGGDTKADAPAPSDNPTTDAN